jgi:hypothetical protein
MQTGMIAVIIPLVISTFTNDGGGGTTLGFLNSGRFVGNTLGSMLATTILAQFGLFPLYLAISTLTVAMLVGFLSSIKNRQYSNPKRLHTSNCTVKKITSIRVRMFNGGRDSGGVTFGA